MWYCEHCCRIGLGALNLHASLSGIITLHRSQLKHFLYARLEKNYDKKNYKRARLIKVFTLQKLNKSCAVSTETKEKLHRNGV